MQESDFFKILAVYERMYEDFSLPVMICNTSFETHWSNLAANSLYPHLTLPHGVRDLLGEFDFDDLLARLKRDHTVRIDGALAFSDVRFNLLPMLFETTVIGVIVIMVEAQSVITPHQILQSSKTPLSLEKSIRQSVEDIFNTMDYAARKADMLGSGWIKSCFKSIAQSSYHILRIAKNISNYTSFKSQPPELTLSSQDVFGLIRRNQSVILGLSEEMGIPVRFSLPDDEGVAGVDAGMLHFAFYNVLHNSFYFTKPGNEIEITGKSDKNSVSLTVRDKGLGIAEDVLPLIFKPYFSHGPGGKSAGIGLGLTLAKIIIEAHGGSIDVISAENEGCETTFTIPRNIFSRRLPLEQSRAIYDGVDRFSYVYVGLVDAAGSPYRNS